MQASVRAFSLWWPCGAPFFADSFVCVCAYGPHDYLALKPIVSLSTQGPHTPSSMRPTDFHPLAWSDFRISLMRLRCRLSSPPLRAAER